MADPVRLQVAHVYQREEADCVPACALMLLGYLGVSISFERVKNILGTRDIGTLASQIRKLESLNLTVIYQRGTFDDLYQHLSNNRPCIAFVMTGELPYWDDDRSHAVVVVGLDDTMIYLNDPAFPNAPTPVSRGDFDLAWLEWDEMYATLIRKQ
ncbi:MAG: cysteine peptidase family C39 domain-containing protein [Chloroflexota bacterium]